MYKSGHNLSTGTEHEPFEKESIALSPKFFPRLLRGVAKFLGNFLIKTVVMRNRLVQISLLGLYLHFRAKNPAVYLSRVLLKMGLIFGGL